MGKASKPYLERMAERYADWMYEAFEEAAEMGQPPPSRLDLADEFKTTRLIVQATQHLLEAQGRIVTERKGRWQRIQIVATGQWTLPSGKHRPTNCVMSDRRCLRCGKMFKSAGPHNRICCGQEAEGAEALGRETLYWSGGK